ncbi:mucin-binding protein [Streptococcus oralis]|uniref:Gram-positive cocci surface proteins LPxTG domain-containing protein n=1 Tax=Streptococcus oralis subsp. tigurinus 2426 TaxID=1333865 RepID=S9SJP8_STROR|nr:YSIRK-type signal peptide-containing protein [Streptococcus oralis]EMG34300.1 MucBP domain protein [Streptococcus oralis subsp. tigurinus 1366]EPX88763.1 hypothetical protein L697_04315 [Streptococcus oralis subsp. tigurinus 2425]EPX90355.1 hypothetical protein L698_03685 [Streptococcus oralis subsp. tigurinus 2426]
MYSRIEKYHGRRAQRFSIRKYSFGAASVLLGTALLLGANAVKADETNVATTKATEITNPDKQKPDSAITTPVVEELPELKLDAVKADEKPEVKDDAKTEATPVAEKEVTDKVEKEKSDKEQAAKKEVAKEKTDKETDEKAATEKAQDDVKTVLTQLTSEAEVMTSVASNFSDKEVKDDASKQKLSAVIATVKLEAAKSNDLLSSDTSKDQIVAQVNRLSAAIEAVYAEMKRAGHAGKVEAVLADETTKAQTITGKDIVHKGNAVVNVKNAYISMNDKDTAPTAWGIDLVFDTSKVEEGDTTTISLSNLADFGASFKSGTEIVADDGKVIGKVTAVDWKTSTGNRGTDIPYFAQRQKNGMTYDERVAEQPAIANETGTVTYVIKWNGLAKNYAVTTYSAANLTGSGYLAPAVSEDTPYKATIKVDGQTVVEHTYTHLATKPDTNKYGTMANLLTGNGMKYKGAERIGKNDSLNIQTDDDISYGKGSKFTVKLPSDEFTYFKKLNSGSDTVSDTDATYRPTNRWSNVKANENKVWILNDGRDSHFKLKVTLKSPTELVAEVIEGEIEPGSTVAFDLAKVGVEKVVTDRTFADDYSKIVYNELGHVQKGSTIGNDKTAATLTVTGGKSVNGQPENVTTEVNNGWVVESSIADSSAAETGAVVLTLTDLETGKVIGHEPTEYNGEAKIKDDGTYETKNILGKKYDVTAQVPELVKTVNDTDYILVDLPPKGPTGAISISDKRVRDIYTADEIKNLGLNPNAYLTNVIYSYVKKTKVEEVNRTIKFVYADDVKDLAGTEVFPSQKQTVSYTGTIKRNGEGKAEVDENDKPIYVNWKGNGDTNLPEVTVPQKEGYIASVEKVPVQATTAKDEDYEYVVKYTAIQKAKTTFVDEKGNSIPGVEAITEQGGAETPLTKEAEVKAKIKELENKGYELVSNTYPEGGKFDKDKDTDQEFKVTLKERVVPVTPDQPKTPGTPVDPNNPDGPKYPAGLEEKDLNKTVTRTITYVYADGTPVLNEDGTPKVVTQEAKFTREAKVNLVTGEVTYGGWSDAQDLAEVKSPEIAKHTVDKATVATVKVTADSDNIKEVVTYTAIQKAKTTFVDEKGNPIPGVDAITEEGDSDTPLTKEAEVKAKIKELENKGYELVSNTYPEGGKFDKDKDTDQEFKVTLKAKEIPVTPDRPKTPGTPVDPNNPDGPKYPAGLEEKDLNKTVTRTITYVYADGTPVLSEDGTPKVVTQEAKFTREAKVNLVTGEVTYGDWTPAQDLAEVKSPVVKGYLADKATVPTTKVTADSKDTKEVVTYKPLGSWIPNIPGQPTNPIKYPNDPTDPTKPGSDKPVLPYVPGHTPVDGNGQPLKPVDPKDPSKGYEVPNVPTNPGEDTPINYIPNSPKPNPTPYPGPTPAPTPKPEPKPEPAPVPTTPETPERPVAPVQPEQPTTPTQPAVPTPAETSVPTDSATQPATPKYVDGQKELPNTGTETNASLAALGLLGALGGFGLLARKKKED